MSEERKSDYEVGFGKPPRHTRFKPGQSGNPRGREQGAKNLATILKKALSERVIVSENGKRRSISKLEAAVKQTVNKAAAGDPKFNAQLLALVQLVEGRAEANASSVAPLSDAERQLIESIHERASRTQKGGEDERKLCRDWLLSIMQASPVKTRTKADLRAEAMARFKVSKASFDVGWD